jgi:Uncharacterized conserved protein
VSRDRTGTRQRYANTCAATLVRNGGDRYDENHNERILRETTISLQITQITAGFGSSGKENIVSSLIDKWTAEHRNFEKLLEIMERELGVFHRGERPNYDLMLDVVYYMIHYPDFAHHPAEDLVFARVAERSPAISALIGELHRQHRCIADAGKCLQQQLEAVVTGVMLPRIEVEQPALRYIEYLKHNMRSEEVHLFPLARQVLNDEDWAWIDGRRPNAVDPLFGNCAEARYRSLRARIAAEAGCDCVAA